MRFLAFCSIAALLCAVSPASVSAADQDAVHFYYARQLVLRVTPVPSSTDFRCRVWIDPNVGPDTYFHQLPWTPLAQLKRVGDYLIRGPRDVTLDNGESMRRSGEDQTLHAESENATFMVMFTFGLGQVYPHLYIQFDVDRRHSTSRSRNTFRYLAGAGDYVLRYGGTEAPIYVHYDRTQNDLRLPRPPYKTTVDDPRLAFIGGELVATSDEAYASMEADKDIAHRDVSLTKYVAKHGWFNTGGVATVRKKDRPGTPDAARRFLGTTIRGIVLYTDVPADYAIDRTGIVRTLKGRTTGSIIGYLDVVRGEFRQGTTSTVIAVVDRETRIATVDSRGHRITRAQIDKKDGSIFGPHGQVLGKARPKTR